jgi:GLPGLI family protein
MRFLFYIFFSIISQNIYSQLNAVCIYKIFPIEESFEIKKNDDETAKNTKLLLNKAIQVAQDFEYVLKFNQIESLSQIDEGMINEGVKNRSLFSIAQAIVGKGIYYQNIETKIKLRQVETMGSFFLIKEAMVSNWKITNESKKIGSYNCIKAVKDCNSCDNSEEVWFTTDIPVPFGPLGYSGLPGLIIEVKRNGLVLQLVKIAFTKENVKINKPVKGKEITLDSYNEMISTSRSNAKKLEN